MEKHVLNISAKDFLDFTLKDFLQSVACGGEVVRFLYDGKIYFLPVDAVASIYLSNADNPLNLPLRLVFDAQCVISKDFEDSIFSDFQSFLEKLS